MELYHPPIQNLLTIIFLAYKPVILLLFFARLAKVQIKSELIVQLLTWSNLLIAIAGLYNLIHTVSEFFQAWYSVGYEAYAFLLNSVFPLHIWIVIHLLNFCLIPQVMWFRKVRLSLNISLIVALLQFLSFL
jgi:hypothetical protein